MHDQNIASYIQQCLQQGYSETDIRAQLLGSGWPQAAIEQAFANYYIATMAQPNTGQTTASTSATKPAKSFRPRLILALVGITLGVISLVAAYSIKPTPKKANTQSPQQTTQQTQQSPLAQNRQNTSRKDDVMRIMAGINEYVSNHNGTLPQATSVQDNNLRICGSTCDSDSIATTITLNYYKPSEVSFQTYSNNLVVPDTNTVYIVNGATCNTSQNGIGSLSSGGRTAAILYGLTDNSKVQQSCLDM